MIHQPHTIEERFEDKYIKEFGSHFWVIRQIKGLVEAGMSHIYLEEFNRHLLKYFIFNDVDEKIHLYGLAGAQYNIILICMSIFKKLINQRRKQYGTNLLAITF